MGSTNTYVPPAQPDAASVAAAQQAQNADLLQTQSDLATQTQRLQAVYGASSTVANPAGAAAVGGLDGMPSLAGTQLGTIVGLSARG